MPYLPNTCSRGNRRVHVKLIIPNYILNSENLLFPTHFQARSDGSKRLWDCHIYSLTHKQPPRIRNFIMLTFCQQKSSFHNLPLNGLLAPHIEQLVSENIQYHQVQFFFTEQYNKNHIVNKQEAENTKASKVKKSPSFIWKVSLKYSSRASNILEHQETRG